MSIDIRITSQYGRLSRGRHSARQAHGSGFKWAPRDAHGRLIIREPGVWILHCSDGFRRSARAVLEVAPDGTWEISGDDSRFRVTEGPARS